MASSLKIEIVYTDGNGGPYSVEDVQVPIEVPLSVRDFTLTKQRDGSFLLSAEVDQDNLVDPG